jgi:hypothetical protein
MITIVCWKWKTPEVDSAKSRTNYSADHVNTFASMISRNVSIPYKIVCITDDSQGIDSSVEILPLWDDLSEYGMCYRRLKVFSEKMDLGPKFVSMDLDCVILDDISELIDIQEDFKIWQSNVNSTKYCGSMFAMKTGHRKHLWAEFDTRHLNLQEARGSSSFVCDKRRYVYKPAYDAGFKVGSDQAYIAYKLYPNEAVWTKEDGALNFRTDVEKPLKKSKNKKNVLKNAKIVFFPGKYDPRGLKEEYSWIEENYR